jgi:SAM-dependent methyltransferase
MERGLQVTGLDISAKSIEAATAALPGAQFVVGDMASVEFVTESFDLVTAFYSIIHVPMQEHTALLERIASWMRPGGFLVVSLGGSEHAGSGVDESWLGEAPMFWSGWDAATNRRLVAGTGLEVITNQIEALDEDGRAVRFLWIVARKPTTS